MPVELFDRLSNNVTSPSHTADNRLIISDTTQLTAVIRNTTQTIFPSVDFINSSLIAFIINLPFFFIIGMINYANFKYLSGRRRFPISVSAEVSSVEDIHAGRPELSAPSCSLSVSSGVRPAGMTRDCGRLSCRRRRHASSPLHQCSRGHSSVIFSSGTPA